MATVSDALAGRQADRERPSAHPLAAVVDRWIYVFTAASFIVVVLAGFVPDALDQLAQIRAGFRPPFTAYAHLHAVLMAAFMLLLLAQAVLAATGRTGLHRRLGLAALGLAPAMLATGLLLVAKVFHQLWDEAGTALPGARAVLEQGVAESEDFALVQLRQGILFTLFLAIGLLARDRDAGLHKRMMLLAPALLLSAATDRMTWLPNLLPGSTLAGDLYTLVLVAPLFAWDLIRHRRVHRAFVIWLGVSLPFYLAVYALWGTPLWRRFAPHLFGVAG